MTRQTKIKISHRLDKVNTSQLSIEALPPPNYSEMTLISVRIRQQWGPVYSEMTLISE